MASLVSIVILSVFAGLAYGMVVYGAAGGVATWLAKAFGGGLAVLCQFQMGRWIARRAPGRALSACLALMMLQWIPPAVLGLVAVMRPSTRTLFPLC